MAVARWRLTGAVIGTELHLHRQRHHTGWDLRLLQ